jgi:hypothetical protein
MRILLEITKRSKLSLYSPWIEYYVHILFIQIYILIFTLLYLRPISLPHVTKRGAMARFIGKFIQRVVSNDEYYDDLT